MRAWKLGCLSVAGLLAACAPEEPATEVTAAESLEAVVVVTGQVEGPETLTTADLPLGSGWLIQPAYAQVRWQPLADVPVALRLTDEAGQLTATALAATTTTSDGTFTLKLPAGYQPSPSLVLVAGDGTYTAVEPAAGEWVLRRLLTGAANQVINPATELVYERVAETLDNEALDLRLLPVTELDRYYVTINERARQHDWAQHRDLQQSLRELKRKVANQPDVIAIHQQVSRPAHRSEAAGGRKPLPPQAVGPDGLPPSHQDRPDDKVDHEGWDDGEATHRPGPPHAGGGDRSEKHQNDDRPGPPDHAGGEDRPRPHNEHRPGPPPHASDGNDAPAPPGQARRSNDDGRPAGGRVPDRGNRGGGADSAGDGNSSNQGKGRGRN